MPNKIQVKRSAVAAKVPTTGDLDLGEIAINTFDGKMYIKKDNGTQSIVQIGAGAGDVVGPASATDNAIARYDGTTGKLIQNSTVTINDDGTIGGVNGIELDTTPTNAPTAIGSIAWDTGDGTPYVILDTDVSLQLGQENVAKVYNGSGATITKGKVVAVNGAQGQRPSVVLADSDSEALSAPTLGITAEDIANGAEGFVCTFGLLRGIDTSAFTAGQPIYLSSTAGNFTATKPVAPQHIVALGWVIKVNASSGEIFININNGWELDELHNVLITSAQSGNTLIYDATAGVWKNANLTNGTGISISNGAGSITVTNSAPDQVVALTQGGATTITGTYPNFTISSVNTTYSPATSTVAGLIELGSDTVQSVAANAVTATASRSYSLQVNAAGQGVINVPWTDSGGTVTSVTGTSPVASSGGTTPAISLNAAYGDTLNPYGSKTANQVLAAPNGSAGVPSFRAIVAADIPTLNQNTTGTAANVTGTVAIANGGTGQTTKAAAFNALTPITTLGDIEYGDGANSATRLAGNTTTTKQFLTQTGTGTVSAAPAWGTIAIGDIPTVTVAKGGTGLTAIGALSIPVANTANTYTTVTPAAGQSVRVNAGGTAWEAYTPAATPLGITVGGTGLTSIAARSIFVVNTANTGTTVTPAAGQSIRINAGNTAWEAYTPGTGTVTSVAAGNGMSFTSITGSGSVVMGTPSGITDVSTNSVSAGTHSHAIAVATTLQGGIVSVGNQSWSGTKTLSGVLCTAFNYASTTSTYVTGSEINHDIAASTRHRISATAVRPGSDNAQTSGANGTRWSAVWAATGTIQTSDVTTKRDIAPLDDAEKLVAQGIKALIKKYRFIDAYEKKGEEARIHIGVIAQDVEALFASHGLDAKRYALWCSDTWWEREEEIFMGDANGYKTDTIHYDHEVEGGIKKTRLAIRYDQLLAFMIAAL